jgi:hypothetical protein
VWVVDHPAGVYDGGIEGVGSNGHGSGSLGFAVYSGPNNFYLAWTIRFSSNFQWHMVSHKMMRAGLNGTGLLGMYLHSGSGWVRLSAEGLGIGYEPQVNTELTRGVWHMIEIQAEGGNPGVLKVWVDGELRTNYTNLEVPSMTSNEMALDAFMGGGGMTVIADMYYELDHMHVATNG